MNIAQILAVALPVSIYVSAWWFLACGLKYNKSKVAEGGVYIPVVMLLVLSTIIGLVWLIIMICNEFYQ